MITLAVCLFTADNGVIDVTRLPDMVGTVMPRVFFTPSMVAKYTKQLRDNIYNFIRSKKPQHDTN